MAKQFDIEVHYDDEDGPPYWQVLAEAWMFPRDVESYKQRAEDVLQTVAPELNLRDGMYRVIEWDPERTFPADKVHVFVLTTSTAYDVTPMPRPARAGDEIDPPAYELDTRNERDADEAEMRASELEA